MKTLFQMLILIFVCLNSAFATDSVKVREKTENSVTTFKGTVNDIEITFDEKNLAPVDVRKIFNQLFGQYLAVRDALVYNDSYGAVQNTIKLLDDMKTKTENVELFKKDDRWIFFLQNFESIKGKVKSTNFISEQRFLFNEITNGIKDFLRQYGLHEKKVYVMECLRDSLTGTETWLSDKRDKKNPYLGKTNDTVYAKVREVWIFKKEGE